MDRREDQIVLIEQRDAGLVAGRIGRIERELGQEALAGGIAPGDLFKLDEVSLARRAGPARLSVKSVGYVEAAAFQGTVGGQAIYTQIADETGRVVYTALGETTIGRASESKLAEAKAKAALFADVLGKAKPAHWLAPGHATFAVDEPGMGLAAIATINADDWAIKAPYLTVKRGDQWVAASQPEIVYPLSLAHLSDGEQRVSEITRDIFAACVRSGFYRALTGAEAVEHGHLMPALNNA